MEAIISVAEEAMERGGLAGNVIEVPDGVFDDPLHIARMAPLTAWVTALSGRPMRLFTSEYTLREEGNPQAVTDGQTWICTRSMTTEMAIIHECAHVRTRTREGSGHDATFARILHELYTTHLGREAGEAFWNLVGPFVDPHTASTNHGWRHQAQPSWEGDESKLYRGVTLELLATDLISGNLSSAVSTAVLDENEDRHGTGSHWTGDFGIAEQFAWKAGGQQITAGSKWGEGRGPLVVSCPAILVGRPKVSGVLDRSELMGDMGWGVTHDEDEYPIKRGTPITMDSVRIAVLIDLTELAALLVTHQRHPVIWEPLASNSSYSTNWHWVDVAAPLLVNARRFAHLDETRVW